MELIIMEDTHGDYQGLNPYYNGRYSWRNRQIG